MPWDSASSIQGQLLCRACWPGTLQEQTYRHMSISLLLLLCYSEDAMRKAGVAHSKSSKDMESHVFLKAKTRVRPWWVQSPSLAARLRKGRVQGRIWKLSAYGVGAGWLLTD